MSISFSTERDKRFMREALLLAKEAENDGEVPVGAVIVRGDEIIGRGRNRREISGNALAHAEIEAIDSACRAVGDWRLSGCELYVTLEPCPMCAGAIINARIERVIYGAFDDKAGSAGSLFDMFVLPYNHHPKSCSGVLREECSAILSDFFENVRGGDGCRPD